MTPPQQSSVKRVTKDLWIVRHGQATHNPKAEAAKAAGCSFDEFLELMRQDDSLDSELTPLGIEQARAAHVEYKERWSVKAAPAFDLVVASPLSRAIHTADLIVPPAMATNRVCYESFREINGWLLNAKRRSRTDLAAKFPAWNFELLESEHDNDWTETLETNESGQKRGYQGLCWMLNRPEQRMLLVGHGGVLRHTMAFADKVTMVDERSIPNGRQVQARFDNCEVRRYRLAWEDETLQTDAKIVLREIDV